jgi:hypothetical protein
MAQSEVITSLVEIQTQFKFLHWQTKSYARHNAFGGIYDSLTDLIDTFVETCMGKHGRPSYPSGYSLKGYDISELPLTEFVSGVSDYLISLNDIFDPQMDSDLLNIRDEMLSEINKLKYLLTLK